MTTLWSRLTKQHDTAAGIYGTILATSIVVGLSETNDPSPPRALEFLLVSQIVFWLAHVYARYVAGKAEASAPGADDLVAIAIYEWPIVRACAPAVLAIVLWWLGALSENGAYWLALTLGIGELAVLGFAFGRRTGQGVLRATATATLDAGLGAVLVLVKVIAG